MAAVDGPPSLCSFAQVIQASLTFPKVDIPVHAPAFTDKGDPACFFSKAEVEASLYPLKFAIVVKTPHGQPSYPEIRSHLTNRCDLRESFVISNINQTHLLCRFSSEDNFLKVLLRESLYVMGKLFKFSKWTPSFKPEKESSIVPVWVDLPDLPINLYHESFIKSIACNIGHVLQVAHDTANMLNTQAARDLEEPSTGPAGDLGDLGEQEHNEGVHGDSASVPAALPPVDGAVSATVVELRESPASIGSRKNGCLPGNPQTHSMELPSDGNRTPITEIPRGILATD
ncbi:hypothetical protein Taro_042718 [Colocasia esculenta]|uniref:DUF4283 domain-containing protein n=1 Tax=Colocasia esculenta TaxID=4460 RepID=A0A843WPL4_COLES|nr:hypothetical protein [Colocasia esculenta]